MYTDTEQYDEEPVNPTGEEREKLIVELYNRKKPYAQIAKEAHISM
jgi:hypothetical protein